MKPTYIQRANLPCIDIFARWGIFVKETPITPYPEPKEYGKRSWADQDGDDIFIGARVYYKAYNQKWQFFYTGSENTANRVVREFVQYLQGAELSIFSEYTMCGVRCIYTGGQSDNFLRRDRDYWTFTLEFLVHKPLSEGIYFGGIQTDLIADRGMDIYLSDGHSKRMEAGSSTRIDYGIKFGIKVPR